MDEHDEHDEREQTSGSEALPDLNAIHKDLEKYLDLSQQINDANKNLKIVREERGRLGGLLGDFMAANNLTGVISKDGKRQIKLAERKSLAKLDKEYLEKMVATKLAENVDDDRPEAERAREIITFAFENRPSSLTYVVKIPKARK